MQLWSLWSYTLSWAAWDNGWSLRARLQRLSQLPPAITLPSPQCLGGGHMGMASARAVTRSWWWQHCLPVFFTLSQCCGLLHAHPFSSVTRQLLGAWLTQTSLLDTGGNYCKPRSCPWGVYILAEESEYTFEHAVRILAKHHIDKCKLM